jgi:hypothetical protein
MSVINVTRFEQFFRRVASLDIDKADLRRFDELVNRKVHDLLLRAQAVASADARSVIIPRDLPITKGLQESIHDFEDLDEEIRLEDVLEQLTKFPILDLACSDDTQRLLPKISGGIGVALARSFKILDPQVKNPRSEHWERASRIFDLLL